MDLKKGVLAVVLSMVWYGAGMVQELSFAVWSRERSLFDKIIMFPVGINNWVFETIPTLAKSNIIKFTPLFISIFLTAVLIVATYEVTYEVLKRLKHLVATKKIFLLLVFILLLPNFIIIASVGALDQGTITLAFSNASSKNISTQRISSFNPTQIRVVDTVSDKIVWESTVTSSKNISLPVNPGRYKVFVQGRRSTYEYGGKNGYVVSAGSDTIVPLSANTDENPDVWADAPWRVEASAVTIPILVVVKDADGYDPNTGPIDFRVDKIHVYLDNNQDECDWCLGDSLLQTFDSSNTAGLPQLVGDAKYNMYYNGDWYLVVNLPKSGLSGTAYLHVIIEDTRLFHFDVHSHVRVDIANDNLPSLSNWYPGDTHYHSMYTDNALEVGAPISATKDAGKAIGLKWTTITDHSFDIDDVRSGASSDDKWNALKLDVKQYYSDPSFKLILGEEVSSGSSDGNNIHFLTYGFDPYGTSSFIPGDGDDAWDHPDLYPDPICDTCTPSLTLSQVIGGIPSNGVGYAAHPAEPEDPKSIKWLNRGNWTSTDFNTQGYHGLEIWNTYTSGNRWGDSDMNKNWQTNLETGIIEWKKLLKSGLTSGRKVFIAGGTDAHGDFNYQTTLVPGWSFSWPPFYDVQYSENAFGKVRTYVYTTDFSQNGILDALRNGHSIMTDGPLVTFTINGEIIGNTVTVPYGASPVLNIQWRSTPEFNEVRNIKIYRGDSNGETKIFDSVPALLTGFSGIIMLELALLMGRQEG